MSGGFREPKFESANVETKELGNSSDTKWVDRYVSKWDLPMLTKAQT